MIGMFQTLEESLKYPLVLTDTKVVPECII